MSIRQGQRVGFIGAGGTGKTTTATFVSEITELPLVKSASRTVYEAMDLTEGKVAAMTPAEQLQLQLTIFDHKIELDQQYSFIADRTILDHYAYCLAYCGSHMSNKTFLQFEEQVRTLMLSTYSQLFFFPWGYWEAKSDGIRQDLKGWQSLIDAIMVGYIVRWGLDNVIWVDQTKDIDYRNEFVLAAVRGDLDKFLEAEQKEGIR